MNFDFSDDLKALREQARKFLRERCPPASVRRILDEGGLSEVTTFASGGIEEDMLMGFARAYGDFSQPFLGRLESRIRVAGIEPFHCPTKVRDDRTQSTVDINVAIDLYEVALDRPSTSPRTTTSTAPNLAWPSTPLPAEMLPAGALPSTPLPSSSVPAGALPSSVALSSRGVSGNSAETVAYVETANTSHTSGLRKFGSTIMEFG